jgi:hypothetical protein
VLDDLRDEPHHQGNELSAIDQSCDTHLPETLILCIRGKQTQAVSSQLDWTSSPVQPSNAGSCRIQGPLFAAKFSRADLSAGLVVECMPDELDQHAMGNP